MTTKTASDSPGARSGGKEQVPRPRLVDREIVLAAPVDAVWKALTDANELMRWFALEARVTPGPGGSIWMRWDEKELDDVRIEVWEPNAHLRTVDVGGSWRGIATDYYLSAQGGSTVLRVVSSGFGPGADWGEIYDGFGSGWDFELRGLRNYLEHHRGIDRVVARVRFPYSESDEAVWRRLTSAGGWLGAEGVAHLAAGDRFTLRTRSGDTLAGTVMLQQPHQFAAVLDGWNGGMFRMQTWGKTATVWLATYGVAEREVKELERRWAAVPIPDAQ
jgi:uncharacterized protein YndB with AHSA1/START domain